MQSYSSTNSLAISRNQYSALATDILHLKDELSSLWWLSSIWGECNKEAEGWRRTCSPTIDAKKPLLKTRGFFWAQVYCRRAFAVCPPHTYPHVWVRIYLKAILPSGGSNTEKSQQQFLAQWFIRGAGFHPSSLTLFLRGSKPCVPSSLHLYIILAAFAYSVSVWWSFFSF